jgi:Taurine catabolism dioxygenase TauD, TfdA family
MQIGRWTLTRSRKETGWRCYHTSAESSEALAEVLLAIAKRLGNAIPGRRGEQVELIVPLEASAAEERSLSAAYGLGELPMHIDTAHHLLPARFVLIGCADPGHSNAGTRLLETKKLAFSESELALISSAPVLVRTGKRSFYSTILDRTRPFLRYDPGCLEPLDSRGKDALSIVHQAIEKANVCTHDWSRGEVLIIDNWKTLHGRTSAAADGRLLLRVSVQ